MRRRIIPRLPPFRRWGIPGPIHPKLRLAIQLINNGRHDEAAELLIQLAMLAEKENWPNAHHLYIFAARSKSTSGDEKTAVTLLQKAFGLLARDNRRSELSRIGNRVFHELVDRNRLEEANQIRDMLLKLQIDVDITQRETVEGDSTALPTHCPLCGAPIYLTSIEWINRKTVVCNYCASPIKIN